ncbi:solute carrier organic anion transporter family member 4C1-like [Mercenaria mercenaria]|uniref:solute carrier organic anion transporter family member 4C1-like n=1 Tax=Mercenaria mercenaria TaxID=6596 RepID=UPI00234EA289|nr:solute carrier organic anion transporter family member 4C1-like [Mercenaria mercenaria]XP_053383061.1 solute carrier organic anion transporter family member 4C1-like [Mercenaria mercenaria]
MDKRNGAAYEVTAVMAKKTGNEESGDRYDVRCGYGSCKPEGLQNCNNPKILLLLLCIFAVCQGFVVNGVNNVNTQSVERRFHLPSSRSGLISSSYDFAAAIFGVVISFFASGRYKARWVAGATFVMGLGSLTMALPHFATGLYEWGQDVSTKTCSLGFNSTEDAICEKTNLRHYLGVLMLGMIFHGIGGCIMYTVGVGLIDDSVSEVRSPLYIGIFYGAAALGPGLGYIVGGQLLNIYVDFDQVDTSTINLKTDDPRWVGAWWLGFFITMTICWLLTIPLSLFGAEMPSAKKVRESRISQMHQGVTDSDGHGTNKRLPIRMFPKVTWALIQNAPFVFTMLAGASEGILTSGFATFVPKYIQNQFGVSSGSAALYTGAAAVPGAAGGMFFGGFICNRMKFKVRGMFRFSIITCMLTIISVNILWITCDEATFAGVNTAYESGGRTDNVESSCNKDCACTTRYYDPVCSSTGVQYFSACHAGCQNMTDSDSGGETFSNCTCISDSSATVKSGTCDSGCGLMYVFLVCFFVTIFLTFLPSTPSDAATLRCIHEDHRTFSMGVKWLFIRLLGTVPGPIIFGAVTDTACLVWQDECGEPSSCWIYDNGVVSRNYFLIAMAAKGLSIIFFSLAYCLYKPPEEAKVKFDTRETPKRQMAFINGSFRESEFEQNVQDTDVAQNTNIDNQTTDL